MMQRGPGTPPRPVAVPARDEDHAGKAGAWPDPARPCTGLPGSGGEVLRLVGVVDDEQPWRGGGRKQPPQQVGGARPARPGTFDQVRGSAKTGGHLAHARAQHRHVRRGHPPDVDAARGGVRGYLERDGGLAAPSHAMQDVDAGIRLSYQLPEPGEEGLPPADRAIEAADRRSDGQDPGEAAAVAGLTPDRDITGTADVDMHVPAVGGHNAARRGRRVVLPGRVGVIGPADPRGVPRFLDRDLNSPVERRIGSRVMPDDLIDCLLYTSPSPRD